VPPTFTDKEWHSQTLGNGTWEQIIAPINCNFYSIDAGDDGPSTRNPLYFTKASDPNDSTTYWTGNWWATMGDRSMGVGAAIRWKAGCRITYVMSAAPLRLYFLR
jgi:hypothetical protein